MAKSFTPKTSATPRTSSHGHSCSIDYKHPWQKDLPDQWVKDVVVPQTFEIHIEYEIHADRVIGQDEKGFPCYSAQEYCLLDLCCDDELIFETVVYGEQIQAWKLVDNRWLVRHAVMMHDRDDECIQHSIRPDMPR